VIFVVNLNQMKRITFLSLLFLLIFSCSETDDLLIIDCSHSSGSPAPIVCNGSICQSDTCNTYFGIWKELFLSENQMTEEYFNNHISICNTATYKYANQGIQFELAYNISQLERNKTYFANGILVSNESK